jgi:DNA-binding LacI/PurR family transcriptional regulator/signal transduction histidine kinase
MRPTLALLLDNLFDSYEELLFAGVRDAAAARDVNLFVHVGGAFVPRAGGKGYLGKNLAYDLLPGSRPDALVLLTGPLGVFVGDAELEERIAGLPRLPMAGVGRATPGVPSLVLDNAGAMAEVVHHLARAHGCRRIAFVSGLPGPEGDARRVGYRRGLAGCRLPHDPVLEVEGDFSREAGTRAVGVLLDERRVPFDALACANDLMALYALRELRARGIRVPEDVKVTGFDDVVEAAGADPPLATLAQPLREIGAAAIDLALRRLAGEALPAVVPVRGRFVPRRSCGCLHGAAVAPDAATLEGQVEAQAAARTRAAEEFKGLHRVLFPTDVSEEEVRAVLLRQLPNLGVRSFYLSRFVDPGHTRARLVAHFGPPDRVLLDPDPGVFEARRLVPGRISPDHRHAFAVLPLYAREERLGFALMDLVAGPGGTLSGSAYEALMNQISTAVRVSTLLAEVRGHADELEHKVEERTRELAGAQRRLLEGARQAGMAEIAIGALHNIGNLLTSVGVSVAEVAARAGSSEVEGVRRVAALLEEQRGDLVGFFARDARAALLPEYLSRLAARLGAEQGAILEEAKGLQHQLGLIRETILALQGYAREGDELQLRERVELGEVLETALRLQEGTLLRHGVRVRRELEPLPTLLTQRSRALHVVVNVVKNAAEAMRAAPEDRRWLTVSGRVEDGAALLAFQDGGEGISAEHLPRVFSFGFTTKPGGSGIGLHTCANMMRQMGGDIRVESEGAGRGARVTLRFPLGEE